MPSPKQVLFLRIPFEMQQKPLSKADTRVLAQVFDPESAPDRAEVLVKPDLPADPRIDDERLLRHLKTCEAEAISKIEQCERLGPRTSSRHEAYTAALAILDDLILAYPDYASARNNRAQLRRWRFGDRSTLCQRSVDVDPERSAAGISAVGDLELAIELASPKNPNHGVSPTQGRLLAQSYTQLAALYYAAFKDLDSLSDAQIAEWRWSKWDKNRFEDEASRLFYLGGMYGNEVAKALAVHTNPHAKLCGSIVQEAMRKELAGAVI